ncbi:MAG: LuxR C-terminal-related transcriptional regulator [Nanoarchaeota archaeon]
MFTDKEIQVLKLRKKGLKQIEIAKALNISQPAISSFEQNIARKIRSSVEVLGLVKELGIDIEK